MTSERQATIALATFKLSMLHQLKKRSVEELERQFIELYGSAGDAAFTDNELREFVRSVALEVERLQSGGVMH